MRSFFNFPARSFGNFKVVEFDHFKIYYSVDENNDDVNFESK